MDYRAGNKARSGDIFIALMGVTGSGKSSFIKNLVDGKQPEIGHSLFSCTTEVDVYPYKFSDQSTVYLIDTPGFNDTEKSDTVVLCELASWLTASYSKQKIKLHGIIYLHNIMENKMQGSMRTNLGLLKDLVGAKNLKNVVLTTTRWELVKKQEGEAREKQLKETPEFWGDMIKKGSTTYRYDRTKEAARSLINQFVQSRHPVVLALQNQMVDKKLPLDQTPVGQLFVQLERGPFEKRLKETQTLLADAIGQKDKERQKALEQAEKQHRKQLDDLKKEHQRLKADIEALWKSKYAKLEQKVEDLRNLTPSPAPSGGRKVSVDAGRKSPQMPNTIRPKPQNDTPNSGGLNALIAGAKGSKPVPIIPSISLSTPQVKSYANTDKTNQKTKKDIPMDTSKDTSKAKSKSPSPRPRSPLPLEVAKYVRSKPEDHTSKSGFRASFCFPFYYSLEGPNKNVSNLPCKLKEGYKISLGANGHWVAFEPGKAESEIFTSHGFANQYLKLVTRFNRDSIEKSGALLEVSLGPDRNYWAVFKKKSAWFTANEKFSAYMNRDDAVPELVAFGAANSFVIKWKDGTVDYMLPDDKYPSLNRKHLTNNKESGTLKAIALDPDGMQYITVTTTSSKLKVDALQNAQHFEIEEWLTLNAGISWAEYSRKLDSGELVPKWVK